MAYPVHFDAVEPAQHSRLQLGLRVLAVIALSVIGVSTGGLFYVLYLGLPVFAAVRISSLGSCNAYVTQDRPRILFALRWAAALRAAVPAATGMGRDRRQAAKSGSNHGDPQ